MKPVILTDIDGVCVNWQSNLPYFSAEYNIPTDNILNMLLDDKYRTPSELFGCGEELAEQLIDKYNESKWIRGLKPYNDALSVINQIKHEYDFVAITALGLTSTASLNRIANLNILFPSAFKEVMVVARTESKIGRYLEAKKKYGDRIIFFVDDMVNNLEECHNVFSHLPLIHLVRTDEYTPAKCPAMEMNNWYDIHRWLTDEGK